METEIRSLDEMRRSALESCAASKMITIDYDSVPDLRGNMRAVLAVPGFEKTYDYKLPPLQLRAEVEEILNAIREEVGRDFSGSMLDALSDFQLACGAAAREMESRVKSEGPA